MTPFELSLLNDLSVEREKFANEWLFKWHCMTYEAGVTDVDDFLRRQDPLQWDQVWPASRHRPSCTCRSTFGRVIKTAAPWHLPPAA